MGDSGQCLEGARAKHSLLAGDIREILDGLAEKHGAIVRDVKAAMLSIDDTLSDLLYDQGRMHLHEIEALTPI